MLHWSGRRSREDQGWRWTPRRPPPQLASRWQRRWALRQPLRTRLALRPLQPEQGQAYVPRAPQARPWGLRQRRCKRALHPHLARCRCPGGQPVGPNRREPRWTATSMRKARFGAPNKPRQRLADQSMRPLRFWLGLRPPWLRCRPSPPWLRRRPKGKQRAPPVGRPEDGIPWRRCRRSRRCPRRW